MFGHLKAKDFVNLIEGISRPAAKHSSHLESCARCRARWKSLESLHAQVSSMDDEIPEPEWDQFRSSVRDRLLSRSIQRESAVRRWTGWAIRPAMAWALSFLFVAGLTVLTVVWNGRKVLSPSNSFETPAVEPVSETTIEAGPERALFDELMQLGDDEQQQLRRILETSQKGPRQQ
jgi:anti-sigma factor RsiW